MTQDLSNPPDKSFVIRSAWYQEEKPWHSGFISLMRMMAARSPEHPAPGKATRPSQEGFRLGQHAHMSFSPREVALLSEAQGRIKLDLFSLGAWGAQGAIPLHITEQAYSRAEFHDHTLTDFLDIFHHRALSLFYRAWFVSQDTATLDRRDDERFSHYIASLVGLNSNEFSNVTLPGHARLASAAHLVREARNPEGLLGALSCYFRIPVQIEEFSPQWIVLEKDEQSRLSNYAASPGLGEDSILGNTIQDRQHKFRLILGPLTLYQYMRFSLWGQDLPALREWVRNFIGFEYSWDVKLVLAAEEVPHANLDGSHQLGYATWLEKQASSTPVSGMSFEPERHQ